MKTLSKSIKWGLLTVVLVVGQGCGDSLTRCDDARSGAALSGSSCEQYSVEERAGIALRDGDYDLAVDLYRELLSQSPASYEYHPMLAAALAGRAGVDLLGVVTSSLGNDGTFVGVLQTLVPSPAQVGKEIFQGYLLDMREAIDVLQDIPEELIRSNPTSAYSVSAIFQRSIYQTLYAAMAISKLSVSYTTGTYDPENLEQMTEDEAVDIIESLQAGYIEIDHPQKDMINEKISRTLEDIESQPGSTTKEKLVEYMKKNHN